MGLKHIGLANWVVSCDDPLKSGCREESDPHMRSRTESLAEKGGWIKESDTGNWACPKCLMLLKGKIAEARQGMDLPAPETHAVQEEGGSPLTAALIALVAGGDPFVAGLATFITGSTGLGVMAGVLAGEEKSAGSSEAQYPLVPGGGDFGGAGATGETGAPDDAGSPSDSGPEEHAAEVGSETESADTGGSDSGSSDGGGSSGE